MDFSLSGLASGFDWKTFVDQIMTVQAAPIDRIKKEGQANLNKTSVLEALQTRLTALQTASTALSSAGLFNGRQVASSTLNSSWKLSAGTGTPVGNYEIAVSQLATTARLDGAINRSSALSPTNDVSSLTIATLPTGMAVTAGNFTVNGQKVAVALTDSLEQVFSAISAATDGAVTASYDSGTDKITLNGTGEIVLGAANDTSNFLNALKLANNNSATIASSGELGVLNRNVPIASARLAAGIMAVDPSGAGSFTVNGVSISYNVNTDSLDDIFSRINASGAGVSATYDGNSDRISLVNSITGDTGISVSESSGGLLDALGLTAGATLARGTNATFSINGGSPISSASNTFESVAHGVQGLSITANAVGTQTVSVSGDTKAMRTAIEDFINKYNEVQSLIDDATKITVSNGKVSASLLADNREIQEWGSSLRSKMFASVAGLTGTISRLENLGIDFKPGSSQLTISDGTKLDTALSNKAADVAAFFQTGVTGLAKTINTYATEINARNAQQQQLLAKTNTDLERQIADIQRRLDQQKQILTASFIAMETAQSKLQTQSAALTRAFPTTTTK